jgi:hypothetical protein
MFFPLGILSFQTLFPMDVLLPNVWSPDVLSLDLCLRTTSKIDRQYFQTVFAMPLASLVQMFCDSS